MSLNTPSYPFPSYQAYTPCLLGHSIGPATSAANKSIQEDGSTAYSYARPINGSSTTLTSLHHLGIFALGQLARQASALTRECGHVSPRIVNGELRAYQCVI